MKKGTLRHCLIVALVLAWCMADLAELNAQFFPGATGGRTGSTRSGSTRSRSGGGSGSVRDYQNNTMVGDAVITSDPETHRIIVITDDETSQHISQVVSNLDRPKPQVLINVVFVEVTHNNSLDVGTEASYAHKGDGRVMNTGNASTLFGIASEATKSGGYYTMAGDVDVTIKMLATLGKTEVLSRPSILARNNQQATITIGQSVPLITGTRVTAGGGINGNVNTYDNTIQYTDVGIILKVTPFITSDGMVEMMVAPEISSTTTDPKITITAGVPATIVDKRTADTVVVAADGQTVIIGGLMQTRKVDTDSKVPLVGDIPLFGNLFKHKVKTDVKTELIIFLTPKVINHANMMAKVTDQEAAKSQLAPKVFSDKDMKYYLDGVNMPKSELKSSGKKSKK